MNQRTDLDVKIDDACTRMRAAQSLASKIHWAKIMVDGKRLRGDYDDVCQPPVSEELADALARHEAQASIMNLEGERHD